MSRRLRCTEWWWWSDGSPTGFPPLLRKITSPHTKLLLGCLVNVCFSSESNSVTYHFSDLYRSIFHFKILKCSTFRYKESDGGGRVPLHLHVGDEKRDATECQHGESRIDQHGQIWWNRTGRPMRLSKRSRSSGERFGLRIKTVWVHHLDLKRQTTRSRWCEKICWGKRI